MRVIIDVDDNIAREVQKIFKGSYTEFIKYSLRLHRIFREMDREEEPKASVHLHERGWLRGYKPIYGAPSLVWKKFTDYSLKNNLLEDKDVIEVIKMLGENANGF